MSLLNSLSYILPPFSQNLPFSSSYKYLPPWSCKLAKSNQFKVDIKNKTGLSWIGLNRELWLFKIQHMQYFVDRCIFCQHNISAITMYFKYSIWQFNLTSEWDLILQLATLWVMKHSNFYWQNFYWQSFPGNFSWNNFTKSWMWYIK